MKTTPKKERVCNEIQTLSRRLKLSPGLAATCLETGSQKEAEFVCDLLAQEVAQRDEKKIDRLC